MDKNESKSKDATDLPEGEYIPDGKGWWKLKKRAKSQKEEEND